MERVNCSDEEGCIRLGYIVPRFERRWQRETSSAKVTLTYSKYDSYAELSVS